MVVGPSRAEFLENLGVGPTRADFFLFFFFFQKSGRLGPTLKKNFLKKKITKSGRAESARLGPTTIYGS